MSGEVMKLSIGQGQSLGPRGGRVEQERLQDCTWGFLWKTPCPLETSTHLKYFLVVLRCIEPAISNNIFNEFLVVFCWNKGHVLYSYGLVISKCALSFLIRFWEASLLWLSEHFPHWHWKDNHQRTHMHRFPSLPLATDLCPCLPVLSSLRWALFVSTWGPSLHLALQCHLPSLNQEHLCQ